MSDTISLDGLILPAVRCLRCRTKVYPDLSGHICPIDKKSVDWTGRVMSAWGPTKTVYKRGRHKLDCGCKRCVERKSEITAEEE